MGSIKTQHFDGDTSFGRNIDIGGNATAQGDGLVKGSLTVLGWLRANGIRVAEKGLFPTLNDLKDTYPEPEDGWWAIVGTTFPADIYTCVDGEWVHNGSEPTPGPGGSVDLLKNWSDYTAATGEQKALCAKLGYELKENKLDKGSISNWALAASKPAYTASEVSGTVDVTVDRSIINQITF